VEGSPYLQNNIRLLWVEFQAVHVTQLLLQLEVLHQLLFINPVIWNYLLSVIITLAQVENPQSILQHKHQSVIQLKISCTKFLLTLVFQ